MLHPSILQKHYSTKMPSWEWCFFLHNNRIEIATPLNSGGVALLFTFAQEKATI
jgi:hypothetical protein